jgi:hypothetical protein
VGWVFGALLWIFLKTRVVLVRFLAVITRRSVGGIEKLCFSSCEHSFWHGVIGTRLVS